MKLRNARLCINCDEVYEATGLYSRCPACASESFRLICEWIPTVNEFERWIKERSGEAATSSAPAPANAGGVRI